MKFRVKFQWRGQRNGYQYSEWFDTYEEAVGFADDGRFYGSAFPLAVENEDGTAI